MSAQSVRKRDGGVSPVAEGGADSTRVPAPPARPQWLDVWVCGALGASLGGYALLGTMAEALPPRGASHQSVAAFLIVMTFLWLAYAAVIVPVIRGQRLSKGTFWSALVFTFVARSILLPTDLILENDIYRYLWDGKVAAHGINPFQFPPDGEELADLRGETWNLINYPYIRTIYPPVLQTLFLGTYLIYPESVIGMKLVLVGIDALTILILVQILHRMRRPIEMVLIYAMCPLVIREIANAGHADAATACLVASLVLALMQGRRAVGALLLALLIMTKVYAVLLIPVVWRRIGWRHLAAVPGWVILGYLPFIGAGGYLFEGLRAYSHEWRFNAGLFEVITWLWRLAGQPSVDANTSARYTCAAIALLVAALTGWRARLGDDLDRLASQFLTVTGTVLIFSPVVDPWYLLWVAPLLVFRPNMAWLYLLGAVEWSYAYYPQQDFPVWTRPAQFVPFVLILYGEFVWRRARAGRHDKGGDVPDAQRVQDTV